MSNAPCPKCGESIDVGTTFKIEACPECDAPLTELFAE